MNNKEFGQKFEKRTKNLAVRIIELSQNIDSTIEAKVIKNQITRSATSVGANYREANCCTSRSDFRHKIKISEAEANETIYWLEIIHDLNWASTDE